VAVSYHNFCALPRFMIIVQRFPLNVTTTALARKLLRPAHIHAMNVVNMER
jgi:hypothetical protein